MQNNQALAKGISLLFLALLLVSLALRFWANDRAWQKTGPTHLAADAGQVYLFAAGDLFHLNFAGELLARYPAEITGLDDDPIDLRLGNDGKLLIAEQRPALIRSCDTGTWECQQITTGVVDGLERQFKFLLDIYPYRLLMTDARGDTLWGLKKQGLTASRLLPDRTLAGPNDLALDRDGHLWVADTDHRRIIELLPTAQGGYEAGREHSSVNQLTQNKRHYPGMLTLAQDGKWWVTQAAEFSDGTGDLVVYDPDQGAVRRVDLAGSVFATDVATAGADILVTDLDQFTVYRINSSTYEVSIFGGAQFIAVMDGLKGRKQHYLWMSGLAMAAVLVFAALMIAAAIIATPRSKRWTEQPGLIDFEAAPAQTPKLSGIHWLKRTSSTERLIKWLEVTVFTTVIVMIAAELALYGWMLMQAGPNPGDDAQAKLNSLGLLLLTIGILSLAAIPFVRNSLRPLKRKIGTDGRQLYIRLNDGRELVVPAPELAYTNRIIYYRQYSMPLQTGKRQNIYQEGEVETWLAPLLHQAEKLTPMQAFMHQWKYRDALLMWALAGSVVLGVLLILASVYKA